MTDAPRHAEKPKEPERPLGTNGVSGNVALREHGMKILERFDREGVVERKKLLHLGNASEFFVERNRIDEERQRQDAIAPLRRKREFRDPVQDQVEFKAAEVV